MHRLTLALLALASCTPPPPAPTSPPPASAPASAPAAAAPEPDFVPPRLLAQVTPTYPPALVREHVEGRVILELLLDEAGAVKKARVFRSVHPELDQAALDAAPRLRFSPARRRGAPVRHRLHFTFAFVLDGDATPGGTPPLAGDAATARRTATGARPRPTPAAIAAAVDALRPELQRVCGKTGAKGRFPLTLRVLPTGRLEDAVTDGARAGTPAAVCIERLLEEGLALQPFHGAPVSAQLEVELK